MKCELIWYKERYYCGPLQDVYTLRNKQGVLRLRVLNIIRQLETFFSHINTITSKFLTSTQIDHASRVFLANPEMRKFSKITGKLQ